MSLDDVLSLKGWCYYFKIPNKNYEDINIVVDQIMNNNIV